MQVYHNPYKDYGFRKREPIRWSKIKPFLKEDVIKERNVI